MKYYTGQLARLIWSSNEGVNQFELVEVTIKEHGCMDHFLSRPQEVHEAQSLPPGKAFTGLPNLRLNAAQKVYSHHVPIILILLFPCNLTNLPFTYTMIRGRSWKENVKGLILREPQD